MSDTHYSEPRDVVRSFLAADSHKAWGAQRAAAPAERASDLAAEAERIRADARAAAQRIRAEAGQALADHPEWRAEVDASLKSYRDKVQGDAA